MIEGLCHQRVRFTAILAGSRATVQAGYAFMFQNVMYDGRVVCDKLWANLDEPVTISLLSVNEKVRFHDQVSFLASIEPQRHDRTRYCLREVDELAVIKSDKFHFDYDAGDSLYQKASLISYCSKKEPMKQGTAYEEFLSRIGETKAENICFRYLRFEKDRLEFEVSVDGKKLTTPGYYRPYTDKESLFIGQNFSLPITVQKEYFNLQNTFVLEKYVNLDEQ